MPAAASLAITRPKSELPRLTNRSTSRVARTYCQTARATPPIRAMGRRSGAKVVQTCLSAARTTLAAMTPTPAVEPVCHAQQHPVVFLPLPGKGFTVGRSQVAVRADAPAQARQEKLIAGVQQIAPKGNALLDGQTGRKRRDRVGDQNCLADHGLVSQTGE